MTSSISGVIPIRNNDSFFPVRATDPNPLTIKNELADFNMLPIYKLTGYIKPTIAQDYVILDNLKNPLILPENCFIIAVGISKLGANAIGGTSVGVSTTDSTPSVVLAPVTVSEINGGKISAPVTATFTGSGGAIGLKAITLGIFTPAPTLLINVFYVALE